MERVSFFFDGFNLYHAIDDLGQDHYKWLDLMMLSQQLIQRKTQKIEAVFYFSAYATWTNNVIRHRSYVKALESKGVQVVLGKFKKKDRQCKKCGVKFIGHEEKETDVNIALFLLDMAYQDAFDRAVLISGDSDLVPALELVKKRFPHKKITVVAPPNRPHSNEIIRGSLADNKAKINNLQLERSLLPELVLDQNGGIVVKRPTAYDPP